MKIQKSNVELYSITGVPNIDCIHLIIRDIAENKGQLIITGEYNWSYLWGNTGEKTIKDFLLKASTEYLVDKLVPKNRSYEYKIDKLVESLKELLLTEIKLGTVSKEQEKTFNEALKEIELKFNSVDDLYYHLDTDSFNDFKDIQCLVQHFLGESDYSVLGGVSCVNSLEKEDAIKIINIIKEILKNEN